MFLGTLALASQASNPSCTRITSSEVTLKFISWKTRPWPTRFAYDLCCLTKMSGEPLQACSLAQSRKRPSPAPPVLAPEFSDDIPGSLFHHPRSSKIPRLSNGSENELTLVSTHPSRHVAHSVSSSDTGNDSGYGGNKAEFATTPNDNARSSHYHANSIPNPWDQTQPTSETSK